MSQLANITRSMARLFIAAIACLFIGFVVFVFTIEWSSISAVKTADGIVALTGGKFRISEAVKLLQAGKGKRLLITGVHPDTSRQALKKLLPQNVSAFECCIDIDHDALDTIGNAAATRSWIESNKFNSVIVVTSSYHMPRSLVELRRAIAEVELVPYPVVPAIFRTQNWWKDPGSLRILISEYVKLIPAIARLGVTKLSRTVTSERSLNASIRP